MKEQFEARLRELTIDQRPEYSMLATFEVHTVHVGSKLDFNDQ